MTIRIILYRLFLTSESEMNALLLLYFTDVPIPMTSKRRSLTFILNAYRLVDIVISKGRAFQRSTAQYRYFRQWDNKSLTLQGGEHSTVNRKVDEVRYKKEKMVKDWDYHAVADTIITHRIELKGVDYLLNLIRYYRRKIKGI